MTHIGTDQMPVTGLWPEREPTDAELDAIEAEMPAIEAGMPAVEVDIAWSDAYLAAFVRPVSELDERRLRRERRKVLAVRRELANRAPLLEVA